MTTVSHLFPSVNSVAVSTKKPKVSFVGFPVFKSINPVSRLFSFKNLCGRVYMVNVENPVVCFSTNNAFPPKFINKGKFLFPISRLFVNSKTVFVPIVLPAIFIAKSIFAFFPAVFAWLLFTPSVGQVTRLSAKLPSSILNSVSMYLESVSTVFARSFNLCFLAHIYLLSRFVNCITKYFDIACKRIEDAQRQVDLFIAPAPKAEQAVLI